MAKVIVSIQVVADVPVDALHWRAKHLGWRPAGSHNRLAKLYRHPDAHRGDIIVPVTERIGDYNSVVTTLVIEFAAAQGVPLGEMLQMLSTTNLEFDDPAKR